jgi:hypothetical protein
MAAAVQRMQLGKPTLKLADYLALLGVRRETHWGQAVKEHPLLTKMKWGQCRCEKCSPLPPK